MPKNDPNRMKVGVLTLTGKFSQEKYGNPIWDVVPLDTPQEMKPEQRAIETWKVLNESDLSAMVVELDGSSGSEDFAVVGFALARSWYVILVERAENPPFFFRQLPWVTRVFSGDAAVAALWERVKLQKSIKEGEIASTDPA